jgi:hypothetical protein
LKHGRAPIEFKFCQPGISVANAVARAQAHAASRRYSFFVDTAGSGGTMVVFIVSRGLILSRVRPLLLLCLAPLHAAGGVLVAEAAAPERGGNVIYVDDDAPAGGDGSNWTSAFRFLQDALDAARAPGSGVSEIRVAQGVYKPDQGANATPGDVTTPFEMVSGIALRGGYAGLAAADPDQRDFQKFETILSGDLLGNDGPGGSWVNYEDNSIRVMLASNANAETAFEGITFTASNSDHVEQTYGGGLICLQGGPLVEDCVFRSNMAWRAGGIYADQSDLIVRRCLFYQNRVLATDGSGGAGARLSGGTVLLEDCTFTFNSADFAAGGGLYSEPLDLTVRRSSFVNNYADHGGGAAANGTFVDCSFIANTAVDAGGIRGAATLINCAVNDNYAFFAGGGLRGQFTMVDCEIIDNFASNNGGAGLYGGGTFINCQFRRNLCGGTPSAAGGAGAWLQYDANFTNCVFNANDSWARGGAVFVDPGKAATFTNCAFTNNITIADTGGAITGNATIANSILWDNSPAELNGVFDTTYSCVEGGWAGVGNVATNPQFINARGVDGVPGTGDDILRLAAASPCIDAGNNGALPTDTFDIDGDGNTIEPLPLDLHRLARTMNEPFAPDIGQPRGGVPIVDLGPSERITGDASGDGQVNVDDLIRVILAWGPCPPGTTCSADLDRTGSVDVDDLLVVLVNWSPRP